MAPSYDERMATAAHPPWQVALRHVQQLASGPPLDPSLRVTLHLHPDRLVGGRLLLEHLVTDGVHRSQFETGTSNGGLTAHPGGDRWRWEHRMFAGAYDDAPAGQRPVYGSLDHRRRPEGGSVRFGSAHLRLAPHVLARTTFCYPDSGAGPTAVGVQAHMPLVALAEADVRAGRVDALDDYVEAQVHGEVRLGHDVEAVVLDPCYRGTRVEAAAAGLGVGVEWHRGFRLHVDELARQPGYRGPRVVDVGREVARDGWLDARVIGDAARSGRFDEQDLKRVWHCTARFGRVTGDDADEGDR